MTTETDFNPPEPALRLILLQLAENAERTAQVCQSLATGMQTLLGLMQRLDTRQQRLEAQLRERGAAWLLDL